MILRKSPPTASSATIFQIGALPQVIVKLLHGRRDKQIQLKPFSESMLHRHYQLTSCSATLFKLIGGHQVDINQRLIYNLLCRDILIHNNFSVRVAQRLNTTRTGLSPSRDKAYALLDCEDISSMIYTGSRLMNLLHKGNMNNSQERLSTKHDRPSSANTLQCTGCPSQDVLRRRCLRSSRQELNSLISLEPWHFVNMGSQSVPSEKLKYTFAECLESSLGAARRNAWLW